MLKSRSTVNETVRFALRVDCLLKSLIQMIINVGRLLFKHTIYDLG